MISAVTFWQTIEPNKNAKVTVTKGEVSTVLYNKISEKSGKFSASASLYKFWTATVQQSRTWIDQRIDWLVSGWLASLLLLGLRFVCG